MSQDFSKMMRDAQTAMAKMQKDMAKMQEELAATVVEGTAGGGVVKVTCNGNAEFQSVKIAKEAVDPDDVETLEDLVLAAIKDASGKAQQMLQQRAGHLTAGMNLPPGLGMGF
jgi:DNA-binding YbaB/EbfC family protein